MANDKSYIPVSCDMHSQFELLIMHNRNLYIHWRDENGNAHNSKVKPKDIKTHSGEEFLIVTDNSNKQYQIRLDRIDSFEEL